MAAPARNRFRKNKVAGSRVAAGVILVVILLLVVIGAYRYLTRQLPSVPVSSSLQPITPFKPSASVSETRKTIIHLPHTTVTTGVTRKAPPVIAKEPSESVPARGGEIAAISGARLAIIIDDMGSSLQEVRSLSAIKVPLTLAIIPGLKNDRAVAELAGQQGLEIMIHMPMQSKGWPGRRLEANGLLVGMSKAEIEERVEEYITRVPKAVGANNHMGSEFSEQEDKMSEVLTVLEKHHLFFVDSVTSPASAGERVAVKLGMKSARRNVFLDNEQNQTYIMGQLAQAVRQAHKHGSAIAICHPHPVTIATLTTALPRLASQGIRLVPVSRLVH